MSEIKARNIADFCLAVRERRQLSTRAFADELGMSFTSVSKVERGLAEYPARYIKALRPYLSPEEWDRIRELFWEGL